MTNTWADEGSTSSSIYPGTNDATDVDVAMAINSKQMIGDSSIADHQHNGEAKVPVDKFQLIYLIFWIQGIGTLLPWNSYISASAYFMYYYGSNIDFYFSLANAYPNLIGLFLMITLGRRFSFPIKILPTQIMFLVILALVPVFPYMIDPCTHQAPALALTLTSLSVVSIGMAIYQSAFFGFADFFPPRYTQALMSGNGAAGVLISGLTLVTTTAFAKMHGIQRKRDHCLTIDLGDGEVLSASIYFGLASLWMVLCIISFVIMMRMRFVKYHVQLHELEHGKHDEQHEHQRSGTSEVLDGTIQDDEEENEKKPLIAGSSTASPTTTTTTATATATTTTTTTTHAKKKKKPSTFQVLRKIWLMEFNVFMVLLVTMSVYPGITTMIPLTSAPGSIRGFFEENAAIFFIFLFNLFDCIGRTLPRWFVIFKPLSLTLSVLLRIGFIPLLIWCAVRPPVATWFFFVPLIFVALFALSNGYCASLSMMFGPSKADLHEKDTAGVLMTFFMLFGIVMGSNLGMAFKVLIDKLH